MSWVERSFIRPEPPSSTCKDPKIAGQNHSPIWRIFHSSRHMDTWRQHKLLKPVLDNSCVSCWIWNLLSNVFQWSTARKVLDVTNHRGSPTIEDQVREQLFITWWGDLHHFWGFLKPKKGTYHYEREAPNPLQPYIITIYLSLRSFMLQTRTAHLSTSVALHKLPSVPSILPSGDEFTFRSSGGGLCLMDESSPEEGGRESRKFAAKLLD